MGKVAIGFIIFVFIFNSCKPAATDVAATQRKKEAAAFNASALDSTYGLLQTGDVLLRMGRGPDSYLLAHMNMRDATYSHCGIVIIENGYPFVYHSIGGEDNPDERLRRDSANFFFSPLNNAGIAVVRYKLTAEQVAAVAQKVREYYLARPKFDMQFDLATDDKLYCSEFVYKTFTSALHDTAFITVSNGHRRRFVGIDDLFLNHHAMFIRKVMFK